MADAAEFEQRRTAFVHANGFKTHDEMRDWIRAHNPDLADVHSAEIDRAFKRDRSPHDMNELLAWIRHDLGK